MADNKNQISANGMKRRVSVLPDFPDLRDRIYEPSLIELKEGLKPDYDRLIIRDQLEDGACVGFALAAVINLQNRLSKAHPKGVSPRMLYEMAKFHDEWDGEVLMAQWDGGDDMTLATACGEYLLTTRPWREMAGL